jgi:hypothetical protein
LRGIQRLQTFTLPNVLLFVQRNLCPKPGIPLNCYDLKDAHLSLQFFPGYSDTDTTIFSEFVNPNARPEPGFIVDFLGSRLRTTSLWKEARGLDGQMLGLPVPADFHAEAIEWIGLLKAVRSAASQYVAMELGAGFGLWTIAGAFAAKLRGIKDIRLCAVEGDSGHFRFLRQHFIDNGFDPDQHALFEAAVGTKAGCHTVADSRKFVGKHGGAARSGPARLPGTTVPENEADRYRSDA